jgi:hypothetical protein
MDKVYILWKMMDYSLPDLIAVCATEEVVRREMEGYF